MRKIRDTPFVQRSPIHGEAWFPGGQRIPKKNNFFEKRKKIKLSKKKIPLVFPKDSESLKIFGIRLREVRAKRGLNGTSKVKRHTDRRTDGRTDRRTFRLIESIGPEQRNDALKIQKQQKHVVLQQEFSTIYHLGRGLFLKNQQKSQLSMFQWLDNLIQNYNISNPLLNIEGDVILGMGKGPKRTLKLVNYRLESTPLTDPRPRSLGLDLHSTQNRARPSHIMQ